MRPCLFLALLVTFLPLATAADTWPQFRGPNGDGHATGSLPIEWDANSNIRWRTELPGSGWSSPVVSEGKVFVTAAIPTSQDEQSDLDLALLRIDLASGRLEQNATLLQQPAEEVARIHSKNSHASPTPIIDGDTVYAHFGYFGTVRTDRNGDVQWTSQALQFKPVHGSGGSPLLVGDNLIFTCDGASVAEVAALDATSGSVVWRTERPVDATKKFSFSTPTLIEVDGQRQVVAPGSDCVLALDPRDGRIVWQVKYDGYSVVPKPVYHAGTVFVATGYDEASLLAIDPTGSGDVTESHVKWQIDRGNVPKNPSLLGHDGLLYMLSDDGIFTCLDAATGKRVYRKRLGGNYSASPIVADGLIYCVSEEGTTHVVEAGSQFRVVAENKLDERALASPAVVDGDLILRTANALYRIGR